METVLFVCEKSLSANELSSFVIEKGGKWFDDETGIFEEGEDLLHIYSPMSPDDEYDQEEISEITLSHGVPKSIVPIDLGRVNNSRNGSRSLAVRFVDLLIERFGGWLDGGGVL